MTTDTLPWVTDPQIRTYKTSGRIDWMRTIKLLPADHLIDAETLSRAASVYPRATANNATQAHAGRALQDAEGYRWKVNAQWNQTLVRVERGVYAIRMIDRSLPTMRPSIHPAHGMAMICSCDHPNKTYFLSPALSIRDGAAWAEWRCPCGLAYEALVGAIKRDNATEIEPQRQGFEHSNSG